MRRVPFIGEAIRMLYRLLCDDQELSGCTADSLAMRDSQLKQGTVISSKQRSNYNATKVQLCRYISWSARKFVRFASVGCREYGHHL